MLFALFSLLAITAPPQADRARVLVVRNDASPVSIAVANDYVKRRSVHNLLAVRCPDSSLSANLETLSYKEFQADIENPLRAYLAAHPAIDFIVLTKGVPIRIADAPVLGLNHGTVSVDSYIAALDYGVGHPGAIIKIDDSGFKGSAYANRFWNSSVHFTHKQFGGYLVTRLDGYSQADALALTRRSIQAEQRRPTGSVLLDSCSDFGYDDPARQPLPVVMPPATPGAQPALADVEYKVYNADMQRASQKLTALGVPVQLDETPKFIGDAANLMGYCSWGSNDRHFDLQAYHKLSFAPGGICETAVSTSARTFLPTTGGQSLIADLVAQGATGAKGYTDEPLLIAVASPSILFDRYARGFNLAEAYYAASRFVGWEDIVLGDPLCTPYPASRRRLSK